MRRRFLYRFIVIVCSIFTWLYTIYYLKCPFHMLFWADLLLYFNRNNLIQYNFKHFTNYDNEYWISSIKGLLIWLIEPKLDVLILIVNSWCRLKFKSV